MKKPRLKSSNTNAPSNGRRRRNSAQRTPGEVQAYAEYIEELRRWLKTLTEKQHDRAIKSLTLEELFYINWFDTYDSYQEGGPLRELVEGTV